VEQVILGYLRLLVNSRDELALARIIDVPRRGLNHHAFTDVKHEAKRRGLSMFQVWFISVAKQLAPVAEQQAPVADQQALSA